MVIATSWLKRFFAWAIDMHISMLFLVFAYLGSTAVNARLSGVTAGLIIIGLYAIWYAVGFYNRCILMGRRGHSFGRKVVDANLVFEKTGKPIGVLNAFIRENCHFLDWFTLGYGFLMPMWDRRRQTVADKVVRTVTVQGPVPNQRVVLAEPQPKAAGVTTVSTA